MFARPSQPLTLRCPGCRHELRTLPDGPCPECGRLFSIAELRDIAKQSHSTGTLAQAVPIGIWMIVGLIAAAAIMPNHARNTLEYFLLSAVLFAIAWGVTGAGVREWKVAATIGALAGAAAILLKAVHPASEFPNRPAGGDHAWVAVWLVVIALLAPAVRSRSVWSTCVLYGTAAFSASLFAHLTLVGPHWSNLPDPRSGQVHRQYPLTISEARVFLAGVTVAALAITTIGVAGLKRRERRGRSP